MFLRRGAEGSGRHLGARVRLLGLGAVLALAGMATARDWLVNVAIGVLILGFGLRFLERRPARTDTDEAEGEGAGAGEDGPQRDPR